MQQFSRSSFQLFSGLRLWGPSTARRRMPVRSASCDNLTVGGRSRHCTGNVSVVSPHDRFAAVRSGETPFANLLRRPFRDLPNKRPRRRSRRLSINRQDHYCDHPVRARFLDTTGHNWTQLDTTEQDAVEVESFEQESQHTADVEASAPKVRDLTGLEVLENLMVRGHETGRLSTSGREGYGRGTSLCGVDESRGWAIAHYDGLFHDVDHRAHP